MGHVHNVEFDTIISKEVLIKTQVENNPEVYRFAMNTIRDYAVFLLNPEGLITSWNSGAVLMKQWKTEEIIGKNYKVLFTPEDQAKGKPQLELKEAQERGMFEEESDRMRKDGSFFKAHVTLTALKDERGVLYGFVKITRDVTDRVEAELKLAKSEQSLSKALAVQDNFISIASHELKTPLTSLKLQCELLLRKFSKGQSMTIETFEKFSRNTNRLVDKLTRLVNDMLDVSRFQSSRLTLRKEQVSLCDCLNEIIEELKPVYNLAESEVPVVESCDEIIGDFDKLRIEQVFNNILTNAIRYGNGKPVKINVSLVNDMVLIAIKDQGIGIPPDKLGKIFERFERGSTERSIHGLGLGLYITKQIIEAHAGKIWVESEVGKGSTFYIQLPGFNELRNVSAETQQEFIKELK